jgi:hypothetical protein
MPDTDRDRDALDRRASHPVREVVLPLAVVLALVGQAWYAGMGWGTVGTKLDVLTALVASAQKDVGALSGEVQALKERQGKLDDRMKAQEEAHRLFKMYTKGRIARLPYRATDDGE